MNAAIRRLDHGLGAQLLAPKVAKERTRQIQIEAQKLDRVAGGTTELKALDRQIADVVDTLLAVGKSDALTARLRELEQQKRKLAHQQSANVPVVLTGAANQWNELVTNLESLGKYAKPDELETARMLLQDYIGEVSVTEEGDGVFAYTKLSNGAGYKHGAEERT